MIVDVKLENFHNLECFKNILEKYRDYKSFYRELKINSLLGNKSQFDIDDINPPLICGFEDDTSSFRIFSLKDSAFSVNSMSFVVDKDINVTKIKLDIKILKPNTFCPISLEIINDNHEIIIINGTEQDVFLKDYLEKWFTTKKSNPLTGLLVNDTQLKYYSAVIFNCDTDLFFY